jgi:hypothetical protein
MFSVVHWRDIVSKNSEQFVCCRADQNPFVGNKQVTNQSRLGVHLIPSRHPIPSSHLPQELGTEPTASLQHNITAPIYVLPRLLSARVPHSSCWLRLQVSSRNGKAPSVRLGNTGISQSFVGIATWDEIPTWECRLGGPRRRFRHPSSNEPATAPPCLAPVLPNKREQTSCYDRNVSAPRALSFFLWICMQAFMPWRRLSLGRRSHEVG